MSSKSLFISLFFLLVLFPSCAKEDEELLSIIGKWKGEKLMEKTVNGVLEESSTTSELFEIELKSNESGKMILADGTIDVLEWYLYDGGRKIVLFKKVENDDEKTDFERILYFELLISNKEYQEWLYTSPISMIQIGNLVRYYERWQLIKIN